MNDPEGFLSRWSRRKRDAEKDARANTGEVRAEKPVEQKSEGEPPPFKEAEPFDIAKLPPIESITAETDIRAFLMPGVPAALRQAALRRAWAADPAIRDFVGLADYDWDFNAAGITGFDLSPPDGDIKKMVAEIFGERPEEENRRVARAQLPDSRAQESGSRSDDNSSSHRIVKESGGGETESESPPRGDVNETSAAGDGTADSAPQENGATQNKIERSPVRRGGGAMPR